MATPGGEYHIVRLSETGSTNKDAMRLALTGEPLPLWVTAERQTDGRGRQGRQWQSIPGNLHASVAFSSMAAPPAAGQIALLAGILFYEAVAGAAPIPGLRLKWPNDLMIGPAKVGGILVESTLGRPAPHALLCVIGFGLNIVSAPELDRQVTALCQHASTANTEIILTALADSLETWLDTWDGGRGFAQIRSQWLARAGPLGEHITINTGTGPVTGTYQGLSDQGALLAEIAGRLEEFNFGDVALGTGLPDSAR